MANSNQATGRVDRGLLLPANDNVLATAPLTPDEIAAIYGAYNGVAWSSQCDYAVQVYKIQSGGKISPLFSALVMSASYPVAALSGNTISVGGVQVATVEGRENTEISIESYDYADGSIKKWFENAASAVVKKNGLIGLPSQYAIMLRIVHGVREDSQNYSRLFMCKPASMNTSLTTEGTDLERLSMTFTQLDPFMGNGA